MACCVLIGLIFGQVLLTWRRIKRCFGFATEDDDLDAEFDAAPARSPRRYLAWLLGAVLFLEIGAVSYAMTDAGMGDAVGDATLARLSDRICSATSNLKW